MPRPRAKSCTVSLANDFPSNDASGNPQNFTGTYSPPKDCPGRWSKVVLDFTASVSGRQYDRSASITVGSTTVYFGTTEEPDPDGLTCSAETWTGTYEGGVWQHQLASDHGIVTENKSRFLR